jgi:hypothetical protein
MSRKTWVEVVCDECGSAEHFLAPCTNQDLKDEHGWVVDGKQHYCDLKCWAAAPVQFDTESLEQVWQVN